MKNGSRNPGFSVKQYTLEEARKAAGFTITEAAGQLNVKPETLKRWERHDTSPTMENAYKISLLYGLPISMITWSNEPEELIFTIGEIVKCASDIGITVSELLRRISAA